MSCAAGHEFKRLTELLKQRKRAQTAKDKYLIAESHFLHTSLRKSLVGANRKKEK